jgi:MoaA/NifB/PqqE/SkfB family radical SAM enzyme
MCYKWRDDVNLRDPQEPSLEQWKSFISLLRILVKGRLQINFAGGEPLVRKETLELVKYAHDQGFDTLLATNAFLIDEEMAKRIADSGLTIANISLDSLKEQRHDYLRGVKGVYKKVMQAIELLDKYASDVKIGICTVIVEQNLDELAEIVKWIESNGKIDGMGFQAVTQPFSTPEDPFWYKNEEYSHLWPKDISKVDRAMNELIEMKRNGFNKLGNPLSQFYVYKAYFRNPNKFIKKQKCHIDTQAINITPAGEIRICFYMEPIGNVKTDDINEVWFSQEAKTLREKIANCKRNCQSMVNCNFDESEIYIY